MSHIPIQFIMDLPHPPRFKTSTQHTANNHDEDKDNFEEIRR